MESKLSTNKNTPAKSVQNIILEKAVQGKFPLGCDSPFRILPPSSTPPSRLAVIKNPFESHLTERLHRPVFSPSVFNNDKTAKTEEKFKWTIEDISSLKPADIDETTVEQFEQTDHDPEVELTAQARIERYFSEKHILPSPFDAAVKSVRLISESTSPMKVEEKQVVDGIAQTVLTLPPNLPEQVEAILKPYFSYTVDQQRDETNKNSSLYRRLFEFDAEDVQGQSPTSVLTSPAPSCILSPIDFSPYDEDKSQPERNFGSPHDINQMSECNLSPIHGSTQQSHIRSMSATRLNFSGRMSVDTSLNLVPDTLDQLPSNNQSVGFESTHSPIQEMLSNSSVNWDMEYRHISLESPKIENNLYENVMDVSTSNTPKSKIFTSQRKKLSDSFLKIEESDEDDDEKENIYEINTCVDKRSVKSNLFIRGDITDAGYQTGGGLTMSEESWSSSHLFASTPTKMKN